MTTDPAGFLERARQAVDTTLESLLPAVTIRPVSVHEAMRYSVFAGGKRLRPALCLAAYSADESQWSQALPIASAVEMIHTYSLVHDDLPAMDNDDFRRGVPTCHKRYGEAIAILAGDALLTLAFETIARSGHVDADRRSGILAVLARAAGSSAGMIAGQVLDIEAEGCATTLTDVEEIHRFKTAALLGASVWIGAFLRGAREEELAAVAMFGQKIGLAFQIVDDVLDETQSFEQLGKSTGKDRSRRKATFPAALGVEASRRRVEQLTAEACFLLRPFGDQHHILTGLAATLAERTR